MKNKEYMIETELALGATKISYRFDSDLDYPIEIYKAWANKKLNGYINVTEVSNKNNKEHEK